MGQSKSRLTLLAAGLSSWLVCACESDELRACTPLAAVQAAQIELGDVLAVGRTTEGMLVVVDRAGDSTQYRLFLSAGEALARQVVAGSGESDGVGGAVTVSLTVTEADPPMSVLVRRDATGTRMKLFQSPEAGRTKDLDFDAAPGDELEVIDASETAALPVRDLAGDVTVEYFARAEDDRMVVTRPTHDFDYEDLRLFFGRPSAVREREITDFVRYRDGGSTQIDFSLDGQTASVFFPNKLQPDGPSITEPVTFKVGSMERAITRVSPSDDAELAKLHFECRGD